VNKKKVKLFWKLHWIKIILLISIVALGISLVILLINGFRAWNEAESSGAEEKRGLFANFIITVSFCGVG